MDFIEGLSKLEGKDCVLVVVDRLTKFAHFAGLSHPYTAQEVARVFMDQVVALHKIPQTIISDRDKVFTSHFWKELMKNVGIELSLPPII